MPEKGPASFPPAVATTIDWLKRTFGHYYANNPPPLPDRFTRREFGFIQWPDRPGPPPFLRHRAYPNAQKFHDYLAWKGPHSCYYSTAYYRKPGEMKMVDKQWLAAELIFDLDADHLAEAEAAKARGEEMPIEEQLKIVKGQFQKLLDEFLFGDFGIDPAHVWITFSGGRGYHAHVVDPKLMAFDAKPRREIVDYITGKIPAIKGSEDPDLKHFIWEEAVAARSFGTKSYATKVARTHPADAPGWHGRMTRTLVDMLQERVLDADRAEARKWLTSLEGVGAKSADDFLEDFTPTRLQNLAGGMLEQSSVVKRIAKEVLKQQTIPFAKGETDEPVTADIKRLIRLPGSLHGKSGLKVVTLTRDTLDDFDPFRDACALDMEPVRFVPRGDGEVTMRGERVAVKAGEETEIPTAHAVWWCAKQQGTVLPAKH